MKKHNYILAVVVATFLTSGAYAETGKALKFVPAKNRQEAIAYAEKRVDELKKMTDQEWAAKKAERDKRRAERRAHLKERKGTAAATPAVAAPAKKQ
jgi:hypothetical protein